MSSWRWRQGGWGGVGLEGGANGGRGHQCVQSEGNPGSSGRGWRSEWGKRRQRLARGDVGAAPVRVIATVAKAEHAKLKNKAGLLPQKVKGREEGVSKG